MDIRYLQAGVSIYLPCYIEVASPPLVTCIMRKAMERFRVLQSKCRLMSA